MHRRSFLAGMAALVAARPTAAQRVHRVATLAHGTEQTWRSRINALRAGLKQLGYAEGRNLQVASFWNDGPLERLPEVAAALLRERPDVVVCGPVLAAAAVQKHDNSVPIVLGNGNGAVKIGLAKSYARPGTNVTGVETATEDLIAKHLELLKLVAPRTSRVAVLGTGNFLFHEEAWKTLGETAKALKLRLLDVRMKSVQDLTLLEKTCAKSGCDALYNMPDPVTNNWRAEILAQAARLRLPAMYNQTEFVQEGGLISYSANTNDHWRRAATYVDRILKGAKPADLPIERASTFELWINVATARSLGLAVPGDILARADRVIN